MAEWFKAPVLKTGVGQLTVGSNPSLSAVKYGSLLYERLPYYFFLPKKSLYQEFSECGRKRPPITRMTAHPCLIIHESVKCFDFINPPKVIDIFYAAALILFLRPAR